ncbi:MAG: hypothetical protein R3C61_05070 [Bacteroidia bacterium]
MVTFAEEKNHDMNRNYFALAFVLLLVFAACTVKPGHQHGSESADSPYAKLFGEVMAVHDEVMPQMSRIYDLKKSLAEKTETLGDAAADMEMRGKIDAAMAALDNADKEMMDWMHNFQDPGEGDMEKAKEYLTKEKEKIDNVKKVIDEGIQMAESLLN